MDETSETETLEAKIRRISKELIESVSREAAARPIPPGFGEYDSEIRTLEDFRSSLVANETDDGEYLGWDSLRPFYRPTRGQWTVVTGIPGHGKTTWLDCVIVNLILKSKWKFGIFSAENQPLKRYARNLLSKYAGVPFYRMSESDIDSIIGRIKESISLINPSDEHLNLEYLLDIGLYLVRDRKIDGLILDPWNEIDHSGRGQYQTETEYISQSLTKIRRFSRNNNVHVWVVAHPQKLFREKDGSYPIPGLYDISGSAAWRNKCDFGICVWRDLKNVAKPTQIHIDKVRFSENGKPGMVQLRFDAFTGRYFDLESSHQEDLPM
jgi:twinkle protein